MDLVAKLQLKPGQHLETIQMPDSVMGGLTAPSLEGDEAVTPGLIVFVRDRAALEELRATIAKAVDSDCLTWVSYPKAGQLGTDLNRDSLAALLSASRAQPVRQISIDDVWSALRFRPL